MQPFTAINGFLNGPNQFIVSLIQATKIWKSQNIVVSVGDYGNQPGAFGSFLGGQQDASHLLAPLFYLFYTADLLPCRGLNMANGQPKTNRLVGTYLRSRYEPHFNCPSSSTTSGIDTPPTRTFSRSGSYPSSISGYGPLGVIAFGFTSA